MPTRSVKMFGVDQTAVANHAHQATRRVRAAAKTEDIDFVAGLVLLGEILVTLDDIELEAGADGAADEAVVPFGADAFVVPFHLLGAVRRFISYRFVKPAHIGFHPAVGRQRFVRRFAPGPSKQMTIRFIVTPCNDLFSRRLADFYLNFASIRQEFFC